MALSFVENFPDHLLVCLYEEGGGGSSDKTDAKIC